MQSADEDAVPVFATPLLAMEQDLVDKMRATIENAQNTASQRRNWEPESLEVLEHRLRAIVHVSSYKVTRCHLFCVAHLTADTAYRAFPALHCQSNDQSILIKVIGPINHLPAAVQREEPTEEDARKRQVVLQQVNQLVTEGLRGWHGMHVAPYGSFVSGLYTSTGDLDISIEGNRIL